LVLVAVNYFKLVVVAHLLLLVVAAHLLLLVVAVHWSNVFDVVAVLMYL
jgi:hypothetical protein